MMVAVGVRAAGRSQSANARVRVQPGPLGRTEMPDRLARDCNLESAGDLRCTTGGRSQGSPSTSAPAWTAIVSTLVALSLGSSCTAPDDLDGHRSDRGIYSAVIDHVIGEYGFPGSIPVLVVESTSLPETEDSADIPGIDRIPWVLRWRLGRLAPHPLPAEAVPAGATVVADDDPMRAAEASSPPAVVFSFAPVVYDLGRRRAVTFYRMYHPPSDFVSASVYLEETEGAWTVEDEVILGVS